MDIKQFFALCIALCVAVSSYMFFSKRSSTVQDQENATRIARVAIFEPAIHPAMDEITQGVKDGLQNRAGYQYICTVYNANNNKTLMRAQADEILTNQYDTIITIGAQCSQLIYQLAMKKEVRVPHIFLAVDDPVKMGIVASLHASGNHVTGVLSTTLYKEQVDALLAIKPNIAQVLFVYNPAHGLGIESSRAMYELLFKARNIKMQSVQVSQVNEIAQKVPPFMANVDVVLIFTDHTVVAGIDSLITLCNKYNVTLYASDLNSADKGAALAFGITEYCYGTSAAQLVTRIVEQQIKPQNIPAVVIKEQHIKLNTKVMHMQGLDLSDEQILQIKDKGGVVI